MTAEEKFRCEIGYCGACEACRDLLDHSCLVLPEMFRLWDRQEETGRPIRTEDLRGLVELCSFFQQSLKIAGRLLGKIKAESPDMIITECLSCRIQFNQLTDYPVRHPLEIINEAYGN